MTPKEAYLQAALVLVGTRRSGQFENVASFASKNRTLLDNLNALWGALDDRKGVPSPATVISWL